MEEARDIDSAIAILSLEEPEEDMFVTKRQKAMYNEFYEKNLALVKVITIIVIISIFFVSSSSSATSTPSSFQADKPGLKLNQYKNMIFEMWQKDPTNPRNVKP